MNFQPIRLKGSVYDRKNAFMIGRSYCYERKKNFYDRKEVLNDWKEILI